MKLLDFIRQAIPEEKGPTLCGECNMNGPLCTRCYGNRQWNAAISQMEKNLNEKDWSGWIEELLTDYSDWLHKKGYIDADYYAEEPKAVDAYMLSLSKNEKELKEK